MICAHCSSPVADEARFCHSCGSLVSDAEGQAAATAAMDMSAFAHMERMLREDTKGEYNIAQMLGRGGMAVVYLATEIQLSRKVAIKVLPPELTFGHGVERFKREAKTAAALDHPNIIPIYRIASSGKLFWYAMKFLEGKSLEDMLRERGSFPLDETVEILEQVADALDYAHEHQVIHRDIKPANVMLDNRNRVIVTDFGIAKALTEGKLTATDSVIGTPYFMSPEQGMGKTVTGASDQYSVAVMAYRMLAGHVPFDGDSAIDILHKHCMFPAPALHDDAPHLPSHVGDAVARALSKAGDERFRSVHDFVQSLKDPDFRPQPTARPSVATVLMDPEESKKLRAATAKAGKSAGAGALAASGKGKTVQSAPASQPAKKPVAAPKAVEAAPRSRMGLYIGIAGVVVTAASLGVWSLTQGSDTPPSSAPTQVAQTQTAVPSGNTATPGVNDPVAGNSPPSTGAPTLPANEVKAPVTETPTPAKATPPPATRPPATRPGSGTTSQKSTPPRTPAQTPSQTPSQTQSQPTNEPQPAPVTAAPAPVTAAPATSGGETSGLATLRVILTPPATVFIDNENRGEKTRFELQLIPGSHRLRVEREGYVSKDTLLTIGAGAPVTVRVNLEKRP